MAGRKNKTCVNMQKICRAVIDVGTNSVKLLVAEVAGQIVTPLLEQSEQTRLGRGFYPMHRLQPDAILQTARAVAGFAEMAAKYKPVSTRVIATSAARDALNQAELLDAIYQAVRLPVEVITGEEEANWVYRGVASSAALAGRLLLIFDVGGGSTEFILGEGATQYYQHSFPLGTVRLLEQLEVSDPPTTTEFTRCMNSTEEFLVREVQPNLSAALEPFATRPAQLVGTGGTTTIMARILANSTTFDRERLEGVVLSRLAVGELLERLWSSPLADRRRIIGLPPNRADVILTGAAICHAVMRKFGFPNLTVSTRGLRYAAVMAECASELASTAEASTHGAS
jgi:exopolyphosphatase / guanosine-5'-triphosphate,3'-diphosphate pyrophosphatase